jgi:hypothetical protein
LNSAWFHKGDKLIALGVEKDVPDAPAFFDLDRVGDYRFESQNTLVKRPVLSRSSVDRPMWENPL